MQAIIGLRRRGFTLVELLAVIAIISLLIGLLVPAVSNIRDQGKTASTKAQLSAIGAGCEAFHTEFGEYPRSRGENPFQGLEGMGTTTRLSGAQWLVVQLAGPDFNGYVKPDSGPDTNGDRRTDFADWRNWYDATWTGYESVTRLTPFVDVSGNTARSPEVYARDIGLTLPDGLEAGTAPMWNNDEIPFFVDAFEFPILYYAANAQARQPFSEWSGSTLNRVGRYDQVDNEVFTGSDYEPGFDLGGGLPHGGGSPGDSFTLGWSSSAPTAAPEARSFAAMLYDRVLFEQSPLSDGGKVWPHRADTFILISPGKDGRYGTGDDVANY